MKVVIVDTETAGLDPEYNALIQVAAIACDATTLEILEEFECKLLFDMQFADSESLKMNSYNQATWEREAVHPLTALKNFSSFLKSHATVECVSKKGSTYRVARFMGHNVEFDKRFIQKWYANPGRQVGEGLEKQFLPAHPLALCTMQAAMWLFFSSPNVPAPENMQLSTLATRYNLDVSDSHDAMGDCRRTRMIAQKFLPYIGGRKK